MSFYILSNKEKEIMKIFWDTKKSLTASEICRIDTKLNLNTVQASLKKLLKHNFIKIEDIVYSGTVLARQYSEIISSDEYASMQLKEYYNFCGKTGSISNLITYFLDKEEQEDKILNELQQIIDSRKNKGI